jgi:predicted small lipoprotein YifL
MIFVYKYVLLWISFDSMACGQRGAQYLPHSEGIPTEAPQGQRIIPKLRFSEIGNFNAISQRNFNAKHRNSARRNFFVPAPESKIAPDNVKSIEYV